MKNLAKEFGFIIGKRHVGSQPLNKIEESFSNHLLIILITYQKIGMGFPGTSTFRRICWELRHGDARERFFAQEKVPNFRRLRVRRVGRTRSATICCQRKVERGNGSWWDVAQDSTGYIVFSKSIIVDIVVVSINI